MPYALEDWLSGLHDDWLSQKQDFDSLQAELMRQEEIDKEQALIDLLGSGGPEIDFSKMGTGATAGDALRAYQTEVQRNALQTKVDIMSNYADQRASVQDESQRAFDEYLQQKNRVTQLMSQGGLSSIDSLVPKDDGLRSDIVREDVPQPDGSTIPTYVQKPKQVTEQQVRPTELANFLGIPEDVIRTQMLQEKVGQPDLTSGALEKRHLADVEKSAQLAREIVQNPGLGKAFEQADPNSIEGRALDLAKSLRDAIDATNAATAGKASDKAFLNKTWSRGLAEIDRQRAEKVGGPPLTEAEKKTIMQQSFDDVLLARRSGIGSLERYKFRAVPRDWTGGKFVGPLEDVGIGSGSQGALNEALSQVGSAGQAPEQGTQAPTSDFGGSTGMLSGMLEGKTLAQPFGQPKTYADLLGNPQEGSDQTQQEFQDLLHWLQQGWRGYQSGRGSGGGF